MTTAERSSAELAALPGDLIEQIRTAAHHPVLLIASDYDGTMAPIVSNPADAKPHRESVVAMRSLAALPSTHAAVVSGRALADLASLIGSVDGVHLVGSHGSEFDAGFATALSDEASALRQKVEAELQDIASSADGALVETKPASVALHFRNCKEQEGQRIHDEALSGVGSLPGVHAKHGKMVIEFTVVPTSKGTALRTLRHQYGATAVVFIGDDKTDEDAFAMLCGPDLAIKVGDGETLAKFRVPDTVAAAQVLALLAEEREAWLAGGSAVPIEDHSMLTDQRTVALVAPGARLTWLCLPRIDSPALFAELLGGPTAGYFSVSPAKETGAPTTEYLGDTFSLRTTWGGLAVTDYLDCSGGRPMQRAGRSDLIRVIEGTGRVRIEFAPRMDFGRVPTRLKVSDDGLVVEDSFDPVVLRAPGLAWELHEEGPHHTAVCETTLDGNEPLVLELRYGTGRLAPAVITEDRRRKQTEAHWTAWADTLEVPSIAPELCKRSALVLRGLVHAPTGAIAAAGTTSLPEWIGGVRNWDYRYCWPRDASMSATALVEMGSTGEALRLLDWLLGVVDSLPSPDRLAPIYTVNGSHLPPEAEIAGLHGYAGSRPVRIGNAASRQLQLDVFGPIIEMIWALVRHGAPLSGEHWRLVQHMVEAVRARWTEPDHGIWEVRGPAKHFVHSKVMCWQTARLGAEISKEFTGQSRTEWESLRDQIAAEVLEHGWSTNTGSFVAAYGEDSIDAGTLMVGLCGLVDPDDDRFVKTVERVQHELGGGSTVWRYRMDDGLPGAEGGFTLCTSWLARSLAISGRIDDAADLFKSICRCAGPTGLMPEEFDPESGRGLGNYPQAYSHLGLIESAFELAKHQSP
jgi:trehalose-phosphatase